MTNTPALTHIGIALTAGGFALIAFTWGKVAALTSVALQLPYLVSGGLTALGLIMAGVTLVNVQAKRNDAATRDRHMQQLTEVLAEIRALLRSEDVAAPAAQARNEVTDQLPVGSWDADREPHEAR